MEFSYKTSGVCPRSIVIEIEQNIIKKVRFEGGCNGNTKGIAALVEGMNIDDVIKAIQSVTKEDVKNIAHKLELDTVYFLKGKGDK